MKRMLLGVFTSIGLLGGLPSMVHAAPANQQNHVEVLDSLLDLYKGLNSVLAKIKDEKTAQANNAEFQSLRQAMNDKLNLVSTMSAPNESAQVALRDRSKEMQTLTSQINYHMERIGQNPQIKKHLSMP